MSDESQAIDDVIFAHAEPLSRKLNVWVGSGAILLGLTTLLICLNLLPIIKHQDVIMLTILSSALFFLGILLFLLLLTPRAKWVLGTRSLDYQKGQRRKCKAEFTKICGVYIARSPWTPSFASTDSQYLVLLKRRWEDLTSTQKNIIKHLPLLPGRHHITVPVPRLMLPLNEALSVLVGRISAIRDQSPTMAILEGEATEISVVESIENFSIASRLEQDAMTLACGSIRCLRCGYALKGLEKKSVCPECGLPILRSIEGFSLKFSDAGWLRSVLFGTTVAIIASVLATSTAVIGAAIAARINEVPIISPSLFRSIVITFVVLVSMFVLLAAGAALMTRREPDCATGLLELIRRWTRYAYSVPIGVFGISWLLGFRTFFCVYVGLCAIGWPAGLLLLHVGVLFLRISSRRWGWSAFGYGVFMLIISTFLVPALFVSNVRPGFRGPKASGPVAAIAPNPSPIDVSRSSPAISKMIPIDPSVLLRMITHYGLPLFNCSCGIVYLLFFVRLRIALAQISRTRIGGMAAALNGKERET